MRIVVLTTGLLGLSFVAPAQSQQFTSPNDLLSSLYNAYLSGVPITNFEPYFSDRLTTELAGGLLSSDAVGRLGFDPLTGTTTPGVMTVLKFDTTDTDGAKAEAKASFTDDGVPVSITFALVFEAKHGWQIDHIAGTAGETSWCAADLIKATHDAAGVARDER